MLLKYYYTWIEIYNSFKCIYIHLEIHLLPETLSPYTQGAVILISDVTIGVHHLAIKIRLLSRLFAGTSFYMYLHSFCLVMNINFPRIYL